MSGPFKMKGSPMARNFGAPFKQDENLTEKSIKSGKVEKGNIVQKSPSKGNITGADHEQIVSDPKTQKSYVHQYSNMTDAEKDKNKIDKRKVRKAIVQTIDGSNVNPSTGRLNQVIVTKVAPKKKKA